MRALCGGKRKTSEEGDERTLGVHDANNAEKLDLTGMLVRKIRELRQRPAALIYG